MKGRYRLLCLILVLLAILPFTMVLASDISTALYSGVITITNNSTAATNVAVPFTLSSADMISQGWVDSSFDGAAIQNDSGVDVPFMPGWSTNPWMIWVPSIGANSQSQDTLYTGPSSMNSTKHYFPGTGGMTVADSTTVESGNDYQFDLSGYADTSVSSYLINKTLSSTTPGIELLTGSGSVTGRILSTSGSGVGTVTDIPASVNIWPTGAGDYTNLSRTGGATNWETQTSDDGDTSTVNTISGAEVKDAYALEDPTYLGVSHTITSVDVYHKARRLTAGTSKSYLRLSGNETAGTLQTLTDTFTVYHEVLARPGGGAWSDADIDDLQAVIGLTGDGTYEGRNTLIYAQVNYTYTLTIDAQVSAATAGDAVYSLAQSDQASWLTGWDYRLPITIDQTKIDSDLTQFPVMVRLSASSGQGANDVTAVFDELGANKLKIAVTQADATTEMYVDIEKWDNVGEEAVLWVSKAGWVASGTTDTVIYLYFDADQADNSTYISMSGGAPAQSVWDSNYVLVDHMADGASTSATYDSTSNNRDGTKIGAGQPAVATGKIGYGQSFDNSNDEIDYTALAFTSNYTFEWITDDSVTSDTFFGFRGDLRYEGIIHWNNRLYLYLNETGSINQNWADTPFVDGNPHYLALAFVNDNPFSQNALFYVDASAKSHLGGNAGAPNTWTTTQIGVGAPGPLSGTMDEVRISNIQRSAAWVKATYNSLWDTLINFGAQEQEYTLSLSVDGVEQDTTLGASVTNNANNWVFAANAAMPYMEYLDITIGGVATARWEWEYAATFTDSVNSIVATPTFRTTSTDADVSASLTSFQPIQAAQAPTYTVTDALDFIASGNITASSSFSSGNATTSGPPGAAVVNDISSASNIPNIWLWGWLAMFTISMLGIGESYLERSWGSGGGTLLLRIIGGLFVMGLLIAFDVFDFWMLVFYIIIAITPAMASREQRAFDGSADTLNMIGFLSFAWVGMTMINNVLAGQLITSSETSHLNKLMFTQQMNLLDLFNLPIMNFHFFTEGIPSLLKWDYSFFGGNAQIIQYLLYSITAVVSMIILGFLIGTVSSYFTRRT